MWSIAGFFFVEAGVAQATLACAGDPATLLLSNPTAPVGVPVPHKTSYAFQE
jgi:hypothetical protein